MDNNILIILIYYNNVLYLIILIKYINYNKIIVSALKQ